MNSRGCFAPRYGRPRPPSPRQRSFRGRCRAFQPDAHVNTLCQGGQPSVIGPPGCDHAARSAGPPFIDQQRPPAQCLWCDRMARAPKGPSQGPATPSIDSDISCNQPDHTNTSKPQRQSLRTVRPQNPADAKALRPTQPKPPARIIPRSSATGRPHPMGRRRQTRRSA